MVGFKQEFNISEFFTLASRVFDKGDVQAMAAMKNLQDAWRLQFGEEVSPPLQTSMADPSRAVALKPTSAHVLTPFHLPQPEIRSSHPLAGVPPFSPENLSPSSAKYSLRASPSIALQPGVIRPHFQADSSTSVLQQLRFDSLQRSPLSVSPLMHEKSYKDALSSAPHSLPHTSFPGANYSFEKTVSAFCTANDSVSITFCTPENHAAAPSYMNEKTAAI
ncbi:hypothetical protein Salat_2725500 [Sesamum alatum]|uniref:Uncharacterized protein n=1 Tax=Sesamum alatum TaxID=300844 RepID=A0AAE1XJI1_9LAMI|nr:hypothetical protein Salat_2725500 [Sesamum alatum]